MRWHAAIFTVEAVDDEDPCSTQRVLQVSLIFEADDAEAARKQVTDVMPALVAQLDAGPSAVLGDSLDMDLTPLARHVADCENRFKDLKEQAAAMSDGEGEKEYDGL